MNVGGIEVEQALAEQCLWVLGGICMIRNLCLLKTLSSS